MKSKNLVVVIMKGLLAWVMHHADGTKERLEKKGQTHRKVGTQSHGSKSRRSGQDSRAAEVILKDAFGPIM
jgi:hypothetical protein